MLVAHSVSMAASQYWVVKPNSTPAQVKRDANTGEVILTNGLIERTLSSPASSPAVTRSFKNLYTGMEMIRAPQPEAVVGLDGALFYAGLGTAPSTTFAYDSMAIGETEKPYEWSPKRSAPAAAWPPLGKAVTFYYKPDPVVPPKYQGVRVAVRYEIYQGIPVMCKTVSVRNGGPEEVKITYLASDVMAVPTNVKERIYLETDFHGAGGLPDFNDNVWRRNDNARTIQWTDTGGYSLVRSRYELGPDRRLATGQSFTGFRTFELLHSVDSLEWKEMEIKKMYRTVAPQVMENPIFMHLISDNSQTLRTTVDQCANTGFEMVIQSFGSGLNVESGDAANISRHKSDYDYAHSKGVEMGGYTMLTVGSGGSNGTLSPTPSWGTSRCLASAWMDEYWGNVTRFVQGTGLDMMEVDGPYPMFTCDATTHAHHDGLNDSRVQQWTHGTVQMGDFFRSRNMYSNAPDWLYLNGYSKNAIGYWEDTWSLPRQQQLAAGRIYIYDGTYQKTPSMGWTFTPLEQYHGGGAAATFEPLTDNIKDYEWVLAQNFMTGTMSCYRGSRLYDNAATMAVVKKWADLYKRYRDLLNSDIVHIRRPQVDPNNHARTLGLDAMMHANPQTQVKGLVSVWNQTDRTIMDTLVVPMFYTGLTDLEMPPDPISQATVGTWSWPRWPPTDPFPTWAFAADRKFPTAGSPTARKALVKREGMDSSFYYIDSKGNLRIPVTLPAMSYTWYTLHPDPGVTALNPVSNAPLQAECRGNKIIFQLANPDNVDVTLYDAMGKRVRTLLQERRLAGRQELVWDGKDDRSSQVPVGNYACKISTSGGSLSVPVHFAK